MGQKLYYTKSHAHKPEKGKGSYQRGVEADYYYIVDNVLDKENEEWLDKVLTQEVNYCKITTLKR